MFFARADRRIRRQADLSAEMDPDLGRVVAAKHGPVLDQCHVEPQSRRPDCRAGTGHAAADHDEIELAGVFGFVGQVELPLAKRGQCFWVIRRCEARIGRKDDGIATAVETGQVVQAKGNLAGRQFDLFAGLPMPRVSLGAERGPQRLAVDEQLKPARRPGRLPRRDPIAGSHPDLIGSGGGQLDRRGCIFDRDSHSVGQQDRRAHLIHILLVDHPAAGIVETLGLDQHGLRIPGCERGCGQRKRQDSDRQRQESLSHGVSSFAGADCQGRYPPL